ncbi:MAG: PAS domain S-box protein [Leptospira sp.]|nr:PAS domain S-box protein [Leptospira sp.]
MNQSIKNELLRVVVQNSNDAILITEAEPLDEPGPRIVYANQSFLDINGYELHEILGKSPRFLQGPKTNRAELKKMREALQRWESFEITVINYKKNGEEYWTNIQTRPIADENGHFTHWIAIQRDVTEIKNQEIKNQLILDLSKLFSSEQNINKTLKLVLLYLSEYIESNFAEFWTISHDEKTIRLVVSYFRNESGKIFIEESNINEFDYGVGLPGATWKSKKVEIWNIENHHNFIRKTEAIKSGIKSVIGIPLLYRDELMGVILFGINKENFNCNVHKSLFNDLTSFLGAELNRKKIEQELKELIENSPDIVALAGSQGKFLKVNPAFSELLGWTDEELTSRPIWDFMHPDDIKKTQDEYKETIVKDGRKAKNFENRYLTKSGNYRWIAWSSATLSNSEGVAFAYGRDIHERKLYEEYLKQQNEKLKDIAWFQSHVLRAPLSRLMGLVDLLEKDLVSEGEMKQILKYILDSAHELDSIVRDMVKKAQHIDIDSTES